MKIFFWQEFVSPHIAYLIDRIASKRIQVNLVVDKLITKDRKQLGWEKFKLFFAKIIYFKNIENKFSKIFYLKDSINICQGLIFNGFIQNVQNYLRKKNLNHWIIMEKINDQGLKGKLRKLLYNFLFILWKRKINGILAIGSGAAEWYKDRGFDNKKIFPFAYFLNEEILKTKSSSTINRKFKFIFVGQAIKRKNIDLLLDALSLLKEKEKEKIELEIIGNGPLKKNLINKCNKKLPKIVTWIHKIPISQVPKKIADADCLVLPSYFDGWGAVVSESLMVGTPVICSDKCGSSTIVKASKFGYIFKSNNRKDLLLKLKKTIIKGKISKKKREHIKKWANCLSSKAGAEYLIKILEFAMNNGKKPLPPWEIKK
ncbi:glycosyltransferase [Candidatus Pelagibacter sp. HIMB1593]|uniref:glycosyltransferase n=1 Tax=Candidatus Pelagibacter sp. HIMB1593 TaxID=3413355 RepID=UPI003F86C286